VSVSLGWLASAFSQGHMPPTRRSFYGLSASWGKAGGPFGKTSQQHLGQIIMAGCCLAAAARLGQVFSSHPTFLRFAFGELLPNCFSDKDHHKPRQTQEAPPKDRKLQCTRQKARSRGTDPPKRGVEKHKCSGLGSTIFSAGTGPRSQTWIRLSATFRAGLGT
jgi:hypothetical protein